MRWPLLIASLSVVVIACERDESATTAAGEAATATASLDRAANARGRAMQDEAAACEPGPDRHDRGACERACGLGHSNSCARLGHILDQAGDDALALERYRDACLGGSGVGCEGQARLGGDPALLRDARGYHRVHCEQGYARSCADLARLFAEGLGGSADAASAASYRARACELGWSAACPAEP